MAKPKNPKAKQRASRPAAKPEPKAAPKAEPIAQPEVTEAAALEAADAAPLPVLHMLGLARTPRGWCVVSAVSQGKAIIDTELVYGPDTRDACARELLAEQQRRFAAPRKRNTTPPGMRN
jgi:hypothetical protein